VGKGGGGQQHEAGHQIVTPPAPQIPNGDTLQALAASRLGAAAPWMNSMYRPIDFFANVQVPQMQMPQYQAGQSFGAWGQNPGGQAPQMPQAPGMLGGQQMGLPPGLVYSSLVSGNGALADFTASPWGGA